LALDEGTAPRSRSNTATLVRVAAVVVVVLLAVAAIQLFPRAADQLPQATASTAPTSSSPTGAPPTTASSLAASQSATAPGTPVVCSGLSPAQESSNARVLNSDQSKAPYYDEQFWMGFQQNFTSSISYNVTALAQNDSFGYGPVYLLNGLTDKAYWYQVGVAWNFPTGIGDQLNAGFRFLYQVWEVDARASVYPPAKGTVPQSFGAKDGDKLLLSLTINGTRVVMQVIDWNNGARAEATYNSFGASQFMGFKDLVSPFPTSLLTEWYHVLPYFCGDRPVVFSNTQYSMPSAWMHIDEWNLTGVPTSQRFNATDTGQCCVMQTGYTGFAFDDPAAYLPLGTNGTMIYANANEFLTP
jgi:hypothetical protein